MAPAVASTTTTAAPAAVQSNPGVHQKRIDSAARINDVVGAYSCVMPRCGLDVAAATTTTDAEAAR